MLGVIRTLALSDKREVITSNVLLVKKCYIIKMLPAVEGGTPKCHPEGTMLPEAAGRGQHCS